MKKSILMFALIGLTFVACKKDDKDPEPTPTPTPTPTYKLTASLDGAAFNSTDAKADLYSGVALLISGHDVNSPLKGVVLYLMYDSIQANTTYPIGANMTGPTASAYYTDLGVSNNLEYKSEDTGLTTDKVTITKFDKTNKKISGTFNFTGIDDNGSGATKVFTNGTFTDLTW